jgi:hypothetical protein
VVVQGDQGTSPTALNCELIQTDAGFTSPVLYDPLSAMSQITKSSNFHMILDEGMAIRFIENKPDLSEVEAAIQAQLGLSNETQ